jgi:glutamine cyclotransferase
MKLTAVCLFWGIIITFSAANGWGSGQAFSLNSARAGRSVAEVVRTLPHDPEAFSEGLVYIDGTFFEGTGLYGKSGLRRIDPKTGRVQQSISLAENFFGEGITIFNDQIIQLTWKEETGFVYDLSSLALLHTFEYSGEGWGLTHDGTCLIMSNGTDRLRFIDPVTYATVRTVSVSEQGKKIYFLNELEYVQGEIYANVWPHDRIARIHPDSGQVLGWILLDDILAGEKRDKSTQVFNGIAYDAKHERLFVTVKNWPLVYEIKLGLAGSCQ